MGFRDAMAALFGRDETRIEWMGPTFQQMILGLTPEELYRTQPHLRTVLSFVARNIAHLGLKAYERVSDTDRQRLKDDPLALLMRRPNSSMTMFELLESLASDLGLYDIAFWWLMEDVNAPSGWQIQPIPPAWAQSTKGGSAFERGSTTFIAPNGRPFTIDAEDLLVFHGWNPGQPKKGTSPVETLKQVLAEQVQAWSYRQQIWQRGGRVGAVITRPKDAPWSDKARERFATDWKARWTGMDGAKAGGTPILEDGMTINRLGFNAREEEWAEVAKIALSTVAGVYHVNPVMVGILDNANFSNTKEFRKMLYSETLGPTLARIEDRVNAFLVPRISKNADAYVEFNIQEKLQGDFEEQAAVISTSTGRPWMTADEARARFNMPALGGDAERLVTPLNVLIGGQASPRDSGSQNRSDRPVDLKVVPHRQLEAPRSVKSSDVAREQQVAAAEGAFVRFYARQRDAVLGKLGAKADWWDEIRWDRELTDDLYRVAAMVATEIGREQAQALGFSADDYDQDRTLAFLRAVSSSRAGAVNSTTKAELERAIAAGEEPRVVFERAISARSGSGAAAFTAAVVGFAVVEVGRQLIGPDRATKTWIVTSTNPRAEHAAMNGQTVAIDDVFSNGADWPGDPVLGADGVAGCMCGVQLNY